MLEGRRMSRLKTVVRVFILHRMQQTCPLGFFFFLFKSQPFSQNLFVAVYEVLCYFKLPNLWYRKNVWNNDIVKSNVVLLNQTRIWPHRFCDITKSYVFCNIPKLSFGITYSILWFHKNIPKLTQSRSELVILQVKYVSSQNMYDLQTMHWLLHVFVTGQCLTDEAL